MRIASPQRHINYEGDALPVENVSWHDVKKFIQKLNQMEGVNLFRLPTEAEWEWACRAGAKSRYNTGDTEEDLDWAGWYDKNSDGMTHPVGQKFPNRYGLYDMHGNVWEWCEDRYGECYYDDTDPLGPKEGSRRVLRGCSSSTSAKDCRTARRLGSTSDYRFRSRGFRLATSIGQ